MCKHFSEKMDENDSFDYYDDIEAHIILKIKKIINVQSWRDGTIKGKEKVREKRGEIRSENCNRREISRLNPDIWKRIKKVTQFIEQEVMGRERVAFIMNVWYRHLTMIQRPFASRRCRGRTYLWLPAGPSSCCSASSCKYNWKRGGESTGLCVCVIICMGKRGKKAKNSEGQVENVRKKKWRGGEVRGNKRSRAKGRKRNQYNWCINTYSACRKG